jgi:DNA-binding transcriptional MerR regulator
MNPIFLTVRLSPLTRIVKTMNQNNFSTQVKQTESRNRKIQELYKNGLNLSEIGKLVGLTRERVRQILASQGVARRSTKELTDAAKTKFLKQYAAELDKSFDELRSVKAVQKKFSHLGCPSLWISEYLKPRRNEAVYWTTSSKRWSNEELLALLRAASEGSESLSAKRYVKWRKQNTFNGKRPPTHTVIGWRFESWGNAVTEAGLKSIEANRSYGRKWGADDAFRAVAGYVAECVEADERPVFAGYEKWAQKDKTCRPSGAYVRFLTGMTWSQALAEVYKRNSNV